MLHSYLQNYMNLIQLLQSSPYSIPVLACGVIILFILNIILIYRLSQFMRGDDAKSLEGIIKKYLNEVDDLKKHDEILAKHILSLEARLKDSVRNISTMRFKAFDVGASNQSFSVALLNEKGNGVIISSLHQRDRVTTFAKPIEKYTSTYDLTEEEQAVIEESKTAHKIK